MTATDVKQATEEVSRQIEQELAEPEEAYQYPPITLLEQGTAGSFTEAGAEEDWRNFRVLGPDGKPNGRDILKEVAELRRQMTPEKDHALVENIVIKTQGFVSGNFKEGDEHPLGLFRELLQHYEGIDRQQLRANMKYFLDAIMPVCDECDIYMCVHPDVPPFQILGLPRIITSADDIEWLLREIPNKHNGLTFCAGSLSAGAQNDVVAMARRFADRTSFVHLRSCHVFPNGDFTEASHLGGRADIVALAHIFEQEEQQRMSGKAQAALPGQPCLQHLRPNGNDRGRDPD